MARAALRLLRDGHRDGALNLHPREVPWLDRMEKSLDGLASTEGEFVSQMPARVDTSKFVPADCELE